MANHDEDARDDSGVGDSQTAWWSGKPDEVLDATAWRLNTGVLGLCVLIPIGFMIYVRKPRQAFPGIQGTSQTQVDIFEPLLAVLTILLVILVIRIYQNRHLQIFARGIRFHKLWTGYHVLTWDDIDRVESRDSTVKDRVIPELILTNGDRVVLWSFMEGDGFRSAHAYERLRSWKADQTRELSEGVSVSEMDAPSAMDPQTEEAYQNWRRPLP